VGSDAVHSVVVGGETVCLWRFGQLYHRPYAGRCTLDSTDLHLGDSCCMDCYGLFSKIWTCSHMGSLFRRECCGRAQPWTVPSMGGHQGGGIQFTAGFVKWHEWDVEYVFMMIVASFCGGALIGGGLASRLVCFLKV